MSTFPSPSSDTHEAEVHLHNPGQIHAFYKQHFYKQRQAEIGKKLSKS